MTDLATRLAYDLTRTGVVTATTVQAATFAALRLMSEPANGTVAIVAGRATTDDGYAGSFAWDAASVATDDNADVLAITGVATGRWLRLDGPTGALADLSVTTAKLADASVTRAKLAADAIVSSQSTDAGSLVFGDVGHFDWRRVFSYADATISRPRAHIDATHGPLAYVNEQGDHSGSGVLAQEVVVPPGATSLTFTVATKQGATSGSIVQGLFAGVTTHPLSFSDLAAPLASSVVTPTSTVTDSAVTATGLTAGAVVVAAVAMDSASLGGTVDQRHYVGHARVTSNSAHAFWGASLNRLHVGDENTIDNAWDPEWRVYASGCKRGFTCSTGSRVRLLTDATTLGVEMLTTDSVATATFRASGAIVVLVDGRYHSAIEPTVQKRELATVTLPDGLKTVELVTSFNNSGFSGTWVQAVYAESDRILSALPAQPARRKLYVVGDSITSGYMVTGGAKGSPVHVLRSRYPGAVVVDAYGGRRLYDDAGDTAAYDATKAARFVRAIARHQPSDILIALGVNDYAFNVWTAANFGTAYAAVLDLLHASLPAAHVWCQTPLTAGTETANGGGDTLGAYRTAISTAVSTRTSFAQVYAGPNVGNVTADGLHLDETGTHKWLNNLLDTFGGPYGW